MRAWISGKVRFVYAGCGTSALSGLQNRANSKYCRGRVGLISVAHQAMLRLYQSQPAFQRASLFLMLTALPQSLRTAEPCYLVSSRPHLRDQKQPHIRQTLRADAALVLLSDH